MDRQNRIFYLCPDYSTPVGGVRVLYRHVDILNRNGFSAAILHRHKGFRCMWFENTTKVSYIGKTNFEASDYIVIPETYGSLYGNSQQRPKARRHFWKMFNSPAGKIIFNQNSYNTFNRNSFQRYDLGSIYRDKSIIATMVVSENNKQYLKYAFPSLKIFRIHNSINPHQFFYNEKKKKLISFMPRKNMEHALQVVNLLKFRGVLDDFEVLPIENKSEEETAGILRESQIFLSFGYPEGFSLPPAEAMACGCIVIGYDGMGGREYFLPQFAFPVEMGNVVEFAKTVEHVIEMYKDNPISLSQMAHEASRFILTAYTPKNEESDVIACWNSILENQLLG